MPDSSTQKSTFLFLVFAVFIITIAPFSDVHLQYGGDNQMGAGGGHVPDRLSGNVRRSSDGYRASCPSDGWYVLLSVIAPVWGDSPMMGMGYKLIFAAAIMAGVLCL